MVYLGNNQFGLGKSCTESALSNFKNDILKKKASPQYESLYLKPKAFNSYPNSVKVLGCVPLKSIKLVKNPEWMFETTVAKPKKDYSKMRILNHDA